MTTRFLPLLLLAALLVGLAACGGNSEPASSEPETTIPFDKGGVLHVLQARDTLVTVDIEIAETDSARTRGLMQRASLPDQSGMLFLFPNEQERSFWMANTPLALDILFANADSQIVSIAKYTTPYSQENVRSGAPAQFVLEMPAGFADSYGVLEGDRLTWRRTD
jgi:uncharacterized membrane protein (UPF0127 family)